MYKLVSTFLKPKGISNTYQNIDISLMTVGFIQDNFLELSNDNGYSVKLRWRKSDFKENNGLVSYVELLATNGVLTYIMKSNYITEEIALTDVYFIGLKRKNNLYKLKVYKVEAA